MLTFKDAFADRSTMQKEDLVVLIVEDDPTLGKAIKEAVSRAGYKALHFSKPDEALVGVKLQTIHFALVDCMLPKMNGRDFAAKLRAEISQNLPIVLMSGIFKDKAFVREAMQATGASDFLAKPFDVEDLIKLIDGKLNGMIDVPLIPIYDVLRKPQPTARERIRAINKSEQVHGYDLPLLYSLLLDPAVSGHLNIITADGEVAGVGFQKGNIVQVNLKDTQSYFGVLLVEKGFIQPKELEEVLARGKSRRMGEQLVEANVLSPHAVSIVVAEQQSIRLSKTIADTSCQVNFIESTDMSEDAQTDRTTLTELCDDWTASKIPVEWLKSFYLPWMNHELRRGPEFSETHRCLTLNCVSRLPNAIGEILSGQTLEQLTVKHAKRQDQLLRAIHVMVLCRVIGFGDAKKSFDFEVQRMRFSRLNEEMEPQNHFERLGVSQKAKEQEIKRAYHELAKVLHPDKLPPNTPEDIRDLCRSVFSKLSEAYETLSDNIKKDIYLKELEHGRAELVFQAEEFSEQSKIALGKGDYKKAKELMLECKRLAPQSTEQKLLLLWARIKTQKPEDMAFIDEIRDQISAIPPEERHSALYYFIKGLFMKYLDDFESAKKCFDHAIAMDSEFINARRELQMLKVGKDKGQTDLMRADLKDVVGMLFKKKK
jgi:CheY-like chemotaxis protein/curved DNA-binding protein CbpA